MRWCHLIVVDIAFTLWGQCLWSMMPKVDTWLSRDWCRSTCLLGRLTADLVHLTGFITASQRLCINPFSLFTLRFTFTRLFFLFFLIEFVRTLMQSAPESIQASLHSFFEAAAADLEATIENLSVTWVSLPLSRGQQARGVAKVLLYTASVLLPTLTSLFRHLGSHDYGGDLLGKSHHRVLNINME